MVPADADNIAGQYAVLLNELAQYNPELLDKQRLLAISKSDMLDQELIDAIEKELPDVPHVFISSITGLGLIKLKDMIWTEINREDTQKQVTMIHRAIDVKAIPKEEEEAFEEDFQTIYLNEIDEEFDEDVDYDFEDSKL